jgi:transcriptional regulator with XRE-family HTH domain
MSVKIPTVLDWVNPLRNFSLGVSIASLVLVPSAECPTNQTEQRTVLGSIGFMTTIPDSVFDLRAARIPTLHGLDFPTLAMPATLVVIDKVEKDSIPLALREMTGLSVETLASLVNVSRNAYYKWLDGKGVSDEHETRLTELFNTCCTLHDLLRSNLKEFLETPGPAGRPIDLLANGDSNAVIGLALRSHSEPTSNETNLVRRTSGLSGWLRPAAKLSWGAPHLTDVEREEALYRLGSRPQSNEVEPYGKLDEVDEVDEAFVAWGFFLE